MKNRTITSSKSCLVSLGGGDAAIKMTKYATEIINLRETESAP